MCNPISPAAFCSRTLPQVVEKPTLNRRATTNERLTKLMKQVVEEKSQNVQTALNNRVNVLEGLMIGGDAFSMAYLTFQGVLIAKPSLAQIPAMAMTSLVCGTIAGVINIAVAIICLKEGIQAWRNGDEKLAIRLIVDFVCFLIIGAIMILASLALKISALAGISAFLAANPWLLPVLFFLVSIPMIIEIVNRIRKNWKGEDLASELKNKDPEELIKGTDEKNPLHLEPLRMMIKRGVHEAFIKEQLSQKMEALQADMGVEAAIETFKLLVLALNKEKQEEQRKIVLEKTSKWNRVQWVRLFQQALYTTAFGVTLGTLMNPRINTPTVNSSQSFVMGAANAVPLYMDIQWPFMRNAPIVVPKVETA